LTGWTFAEIEATDRARLERYIIYRNVRQVAEHGGEYDP